MILVARWESYFDADLLSSLDTKGNKKLGLMRVVDYSPEKLLDSANTSVLGRNLKRMIQRLRSSDVNIWILKKVPGIEDKHCAKHVYMQKRYSALNNMPVYGVPKFDHQLLRDSAEKALADSMGNGVTVVDATSKFIEENDMIKVYADRAFYRDSGHLTRAGADYYLSEIFNTMFSQFQRDSTE